MVRPTAAQPSSGPGQFDAHADVGPVGVSGSATYDSVAQRYVISGGGDGTVDEAAGHFARVRVGGDFVVRARATFRDTDAEGSMGWLVRSGESDGTPFVAATIRHDGQAVFRVRRKGADRVQERELEVEAPDVVQLERDGDRYTMSVAKHGDPLQRSDAIRLELQEEVDVGLFVSSNATEERATAEFDNVRLITPAPDDLEAYDDYLGSNLETLDVATGRRTIVHRSTESLQAPNWTPDGQALIYNSNGLLYRFGLKQGTIDEIDTGFADQNNNDHVISFDGTRIGISHHPEEHDGVSIIYTVPIEGGTPTKVTPKGPSYLHGWSPDDKYVTYTGARNGEFDVYKIPVQGGEETRLTTAEGLDDGSEYTPDGEYIYFNSVRSGRMEIWRMRPDGRGKEQLTDDRFNNWFPHISPDGDTVVFLSYSDDVPPGDHPFYKHVYLRKMPLDGGEPEVIAYLYGGQGTINVPSWSPDSERVAFVSNTGTLFGSP